MTTSRTRIAPIDLLLYALGVAGGGLMVGQLFDAVWIRVLVAVVPAVLVAAALSRGLPARGRGPASAAW